MAKADKKRKRGSLTDGDREYIIAQMSGLHGAACARKAEWLAEMYGVTTNRCYELSRHVRPRRGTRSDKFLLAGDIARLLERQEKTVDDYDMLIKLLKAGLKKKENTPEQHSRLSGELRRALRDREALIRRLDHEKQSSSIARRLESEQPPEEDLSKNYEHGIRAVMTVALMTSKRVLCETLGYDWAPYYSKVDNLEREHSDQNMVLAPRGGGKSTRRTIINSISDLLNDPNIRIGIFSDAGSQAGGLLFEIAAHLMTNETLIWCFGPFFSPFRRWQESKSIIIAQRRANWKEGTIDAWGKDSRGLTSKHYDKIRLDDFVSEENARTETQRTKLEQFWKKKVRPCKLVHTQFEFTGTRYHYADLWAKLLAGACRDKTLIVKAIDQDSLGRERSFWPRLFPLNSRRDGDTVIEGLRQTREESGHIIWNCQYQNDTEAMKGSIFKYEWLDFVDANDVPEDLRIHQGVDLAISEKDKSAYFVIVTIGYQVKKKHFYIMDVYRRRLSFMQQTKAIESKFKQYDAIRTGIESNAYQAAQAQVTRETTDVRVKEVHTDKDKVTRAQKNSALFENGKVSLVRARWNTDFIEELLSAPDCEQWDQLDALDVALRTAKSSGARMRVIKRKAA